MRRSAIVFFSMLLTFIGTIPMLFNSPVTAAPLPSPSGPNRYTGIDLDITQTEWWMARWKNNVVKCAFWSEHDGMPYPYEIQDACSKDVFEEWKTINCVDHIDECEDVDYDISKLVNLPCNENDPKDCPGFYFVKAGERTRKEQIAVKLSPPTVSVSLAECDPDAFGWCRSEPKLILQAAEPLPNEKITSIKGFAGGDEFSCDGDRCVFTLDKTVKDGVFIEFWANSSYGDSSDVFTALVRVLKDDGYNRLIPRWRVDVFSTQWVGEKNLSCSDIWQTFKPENDLPEWLTTPSSSDGLNSNIPYDYLAENLIKQGLVDVSQCTDGWLNPDGSVNDCGSTAASPEVTKWQNRFDTLIIKVSDKKDVPGQLLKNLFSRESQFWPGVFRNSSDIGLGQMTENGADTALLWNPAFYEQFCPLVLDGSLCGETGYANLDEQDQNLLKSALVNSVDARCADCPLGIDLSRADFSVGIFAQTLLANCEQAGKVVENITDEKPGINLDYETMWKLTLVNYNAGAGCLFNAVDTAYDPSGETPLDWDNISSALRDICPGAVLYVEDISADR